MDVYDTLPGEKASSNTTIYSVSHISIWNHFSCFVLKCVMCLNACRKDSVNVCYIIWRPTEALGE